MSPQIAITERTAQLLAALHKGGSWAYWWTEKGNISRWWKVGEPAPIPEGWKNVYYPVNPTNEIPPTNADGEPKPPEQVRSRYEFIAATNCLFAEFDAKDFQDDKAGALAHVTGLQVLPSILVDSGGGYHGYWILQDTFYLATDADRKRAQELQAAWVMFTGGDPGAKDLPRVLRVPGTYNHKPAYNPPRPVVYVWADFDLLHDINELEALSRPPEAPRKPAISGNGRFSTDAGSYWLKQAILRAHAGIRNDSGLWLALQLRDTVRLTQGEAESVMLDYAHQAPAGDHPYTTSEALATLRSVYSRAPRDPARSIHAPNSYLHNLSGGNGSQPDLSLAPDSDQMPTIPTQGSLTDTANAFRLATRFGDRLCWNKEWGWLAWDGRRWEADQNEAAMKMAKATARSIYLEASQAEDDHRAKDLSSWAGRSLNRSKLDNMLYLARSELQTDSRYFDADPWVMNVTNGILDLRTGELMPHDKQALITKIAGVEYDPEAVCPTWEQFLQHIFEGDQSKIDFIQRAVGYSLTGVTLEQVFFFLYGTGANGKSTFSNAIHEIMGEYAMKARAEVLMKGRFDAIPEETAQIAGVRFMLAAELGEGQRLNEPLIKDLTGGDKLRARLLYRKSFEFYPVAKVWLYGNHKPSIYGTDEGIWRRPKLIPFTVRIPEPDQDKQLPDKLHAELPGILAWAVRGCLQWQRIGLKPPHSINAATAEFRAEQDIIGQFLEECCIQNDLASVTAGELYEAYKSWCETSGMNSKSQFVFSRQMGERGYSTTNPDGSKRRDSSGRAYYVGLGLLKGSNNGPEL